MAIANLLNVPGTQQELDIWNFAHAAAHVDINRLILETHNVSLPAFVLDPMDPLRTDFYNWLYLHQEMHNAQNNVLGISGYDLLDIDWKDPGQRAGWIYLHENEHYQASDILGIG